jgi:hypothetical protein
MAPRRAPKLVFPADIHHIAAEIRRQALAHPDRDPVVPGAPRRRTKKTKTTKAVAARRKKATKARTTTRARRK